MGIEVACSLRGYLLSQSKNIAGILERSRLTNNKTINTLIEVNAIYSFFGLFTFVRSYFIPYYWWELNKSHYYLSKCYIYCSCC
jgi:hypothetical protein